MAVEYDLEQERQFRYTGLSRQQVADRLSRFVSGLWQIHPFAEGNTRTTAIFAIKYLRSLGFSDVNNDMFERHSWYFRNALVRANYRNVAKGIDYEPAYLVRFFRNLLYGETNELRNRLLLVNPPSEWEQPEAEPVATPQVPHKHPTSWDEVGEKTWELVNIIGNKQLSIREMLTAMGLKDRKNFMELVLNPAMAEGVVRLLYPDKPRHPRQKYLLTVKGMLLYDSVAKDKDGSAQ